MFEEMVRNAEQLEKTAVGQGRGYPCSVWYGTKIAHQFVVDYDEQGEPDRVQVVGTSITFHRSG